MAKRSKAYIWQFVIGLGLLSGIWTAIGIDPEAVILNVVGNLVVTVYSHPMARSLLIVLPTVLLLISIIGAYRRGRVLGLISVIVAYSFSSQSYLRQSSSLSQLLSDIWQPTGV
jgi:hypothetical protein